MKNILGISFLVFIFSLCFSSQLEDIFGDNFYWFIGIILFLIPILIFFNSIWEGMINTKPLYDPYKNAPGSLRRYFWLWK
jgi:hypothetical protein